VFGGKPSALLLPPGERFRLHARTPLHLAIVSAPAKSTLPARLIRPDGVRVEMRGKGVTERRIHWILSEKDPAARLLLVEVLTPAGHWSTYPPHKHDEDKAGVERALEELYYYQFNPRQGFAFQGIYTKPSPSPARGGGPGVGPEVVVMGRLSADIYPAQIRTPLREQRNYVRYVGGFAGNVCTGLARLQVRTAIVSKVGNDGHGEFIRDFL